MASILSKTLNLPALPLGLRLASAVVAVVLLAALNLAVTRPVPSPARAVWPEVGKAVVSEAPTLVASGRIPMPEDTPAAHASSLLALPATSKSALLAFWFAGEGESAPDVGIASSQFDRAKQQWSPAPAAQAPAAAAATSSAPSLSYGSLKNRFLSGSTAKSSAPTSGAAATSGKSKLFSLAR